MSTLVLEEPTQKVDKFTTLYRAIHMRQGIFTIILIQTTLDNHAKVIQKISQNYQEFEDLFGVSFVQLKVDTFIDVNKGFDPLRLLNKVAERPKTEISLMLITELEKIVGETPVIDDIAIKQLVHALEPIRKNQRLFQRQINFPVLFCLPYTDTDMEVLLDQPIALTNTTFFYDLRDFEG